MKNFLLLLFVVPVMAYCQTSDNEEVGKTLDAWHLAAAEGKFDAYFSHFTRDGIFIGTDATENWNVNQFKAFAKPYFDKGKAWDFKPVQRNIYFVGDVAYFDELLSSWMKLCRGSGVMRKENGQWKIAHYVLSMTIPNDNVDQIVKIKQPVEDKQLEKLRQ